MLNVDISPHCQLAEGVDFHCSNILSVLNKHGITNNEAAKSLMWNYRSGVNFRDLDVAKRGGTDGKLNSAATSQVNFNFPAILGTDATTVTATSNDAPPA